MKLGLILALLPAALLPAEIHVKTAATRGGVPFGWVGEKPESPAPTVFFFGGAIADSLTQPHYQDAIDGLGPAVFKVTMDLPGHGSDKRPDEPASLQAWRHRLDRGEDLTGEFVRRASPVLDYLVEAKLTDPARVAVFGTSRGGFMAFHFAAQDPRVRYIAGFAPVTDLLALREFFEMPGKERARAIAARQLADRLHDRSVWITIGSTDDRVDTNRAIEFTQRVVEAADARGARPRIELHVEPSEGHRAPDGAYGSAARWLLKQWR
jgi:alpha-beta hydrolase superfamily lysophospholipase